MPPKSIEKYIAEIKEMGHAKDDNGKGSLKKCPVCKKEKRFDEFNKCKTNKDGIDGKCKDCKKEYRIRNREQISARGKQYYKENKDTIIEKVRVYRVENKEKILQNKRRYYEENANYIKKYNRALASINVERHRILGKRWREANKEKITEAKKEYNNTPTGKSVRRRIDHVRRGFGFEPINGYFLESEFHHLHINNNNSIGVFIPSELHKSIFHKSTNGFGMRKINKAALEWLCEQAVI